MKKVISSILCVLLIISLFAFVHAEESSTDTDDSAFDYSAEQQKVE